MEYEDFMEILGGNSKKEDNILVDREEYERFKGDALRYEQMKKGILLGSTYESDMTQGLELVSKVLEQYAAIGTSEELRLVLDKAQKYDNLQKNLAEAKKRLDEYKEPDFGSIDNLDNTHDIRTLTARLDELNKKAIADVSERITERESTLQGFDAALKAIEYQKSIAESLKTELEKYKALGTPEELKQRIENLEEELNKAIIAIKYHRLGLGLDKP